MRYHLLRDTTYREHFDALRQWYVDNGGIQNPWRFDIDLTRESVVVDVGAYVGDWAEEIVRRYDPYVLCLEPVPEHYEVLHRRFGRAKVKVFEFGLSDRDRTVEFYAKGPGSGVFGRGARRRRVELRDVTGFFQEQSLGRVDLLKLNIEGCEYQVLTRLIESGLVTRCRNLLIQFHNFVPDAVALRRRIQGSLEATHENVYDYAWVWERWRLK